MTERRYSEDEAAEIFRLAAELEEGSPRAIARTDGLTMAQLQEIGREAGLNPDLIARAATAATTSVPARVSRTFGLPLSVGRTIELDRPFSDEDWERLVSELRQKFDARGVVRYDGPFREWSNGNLHVLVEPTPGAHRIRFRTTNGLSRTLLVGGGLMLTISAIVTTLSMLTGAGAAEAMSKMGALVSMAAAMVGYGAIRLPSWARLRRQQMDDLAENLLQPGEGAPAQ